jgi:hypothetical protein
MALAWAAGCVQVASVLKGLDDLSKMYFKELAAAFVLVTEVVEVSAALLPCLRCGAPSEHLHNHVMSCC